MSSTDAPTFPTGIDKLQANVDAFADRYSHHRLHQAPGDACKKLKGRKRQVMVETDDRAPVLDPQPANVQDRDGAVPILKLSRRSFPFVSKAFADAAYAG